MSKPVGILGALHVHASTHDIGMCVAGEHVVCVACVGELRWRLVRSPEKSRGGTFVKKMLLTEVEAV